MGQLMEGPWKAKGWNVYTEEGERVCVVYGDEEEEAEELAARVARLPWCEKEVGRLHEIVLAQEGEIRELRERLGKVSLRPSPKSYDGVLSSPPIEEVLRKHIAVLSEEVDKRNAMLERLLETNRRSLELLEAAVQKTEKGRENNEELRKIERILEGILEKLGGPPQK